MLKRKGHIVELQSLRGLAATMVAIGHSLSVMDNPPWLANISVIMNGRAAVVLFFILSGYVLTRSFEGKPYGRAPVVDFYVKRVARIYPAIWFVSILGLLYLVFLHWSIPVPHEGAGFQQRFRADRMHPLFIIASFAGMLAFIIPQSWSIFVEILGSIALPFIGFLAFRKKKLFLLALVASVTVSFAIGANTYYHFGLYFEDFFFGAALAVFPRQLTVIFGAKRFPYLPLFAALSFGLLFTQYIPLDYWNPISALIEAAISFAIIGIIIYSDIVVRILRNPTVVYIGDISYSIYIVHFLIVCLCAKAITLVENVYGARLPIAEKTLLITSFTLLVTFPVSGLIYEWIEKPGILIGKRLAAAMQRGGGANRVSAAREPSV